MSVYGEEEQDDEEQQLEKDPREPDEKQSRYDFLVEDSILRSQDINDKAGNPTGETEAIVDPVTCYEIKEVQLDSNKMPVIKKGRFVTEYIPLGESDDDELQLFIKRILMPPNEMMLDKFGSNKLSWHPHAGQRVQTNDQMEAVRAQFDDAPHPGYMTVPDLPLSVNAAMAQEVTTVSRDLHAIATATIDGLLKDPTSKPAAAATQSTTTTPVIVVNSAAEEADDGTSDTEEEDGSK